MSNVIYKTNRDIPQEMLLGNMSFIKLCDMRITKEELLEIFKRNHLSENYINNFSLSDVFRRATSSVKNMIIQTKQGYKIRIEVDEIKKDNEIKRIIGFKRVDQKQDKISYNPLIAATFNRITQTIYCTPIIESEVIKVQMDDIINNLSNLITSRYEDWSYYHNVDTIRNIVTKMTADMHPINLLSTGICKFISKNYSDTLYNLKNALMDLNQYTVQKNESNAMEIVPIIDTEEQRDLIQKVFTSEVKDEMEELSNELLSVIQAKGTISKAKATSFINKFHMLQDKNKEYESILSIYSEIIHKQIKNMFQLIDDNKV